MTETNDVKITVQEGDLGRSILPWRVRDRRIAPNTGTRTM